MSLSHRLYDERGTIDVNFIDGVFKELDDVTGWLPSAQDYSLLLGSEPSEVVEIIPLISDAGEQLDAASYVQAIVTAVNQIEELLRLATLWYDDPTRQNQVWHAWQADGGLPSRAVVIGGSFQPLNGEVATVWLEPGRRVRANLVLRQLPGREATTTRDASLPGLVTGGQYNMAGGPPTRPGQTRSHTVSALGGQLTLYGQGTTTSRIHKLEITKSQAILSLETVWLGIRPFNKGLSFTARHECEDGSYSPPTTLVTGDSTASGDAYLATTFTPADTFHTVFTSTITGGNPRQYYGRYTLLYRYRTSADIVIGLRLSSGEATLHQAEEILLPASPNHWSIIELGAVQIPRVSGRAIFDDIVQGFTLTVEAEQIGASGGTLDSDCFILMPNAHSFKYTDGLANLKVVRIATAEDGVTSALEHNGVTFTRELTIEQASQWHLPAEGGALVVVATRLNGEQVVGDELNIAVEVVDRWATYPQGGS